MKVALIHDWLVGMRGGERCLEAFLSLFPEADIYTLFYDSSQVSPIIRERDPFVSILDRIPGAKHKHRYCLPFYPMAIRDLSAKLQRNARHSPYDLVISISHCAAKNVLVPENVPHICYCLTPMRYIWDQYDAYFKGRAIEPIARVVSAGLRRWDKSRAGNVDYFIAISKFVRRRIANVYGRSSDVIYPPVNTDWISPCSQGSAGEAFLCVNALVPYKNVHAVVAAFNQLGEKLIIVGTGPEEARLKSIAKSNIKFVGNVSEFELAELYRKSRAMVFAAEEDFGMTPVEMQAAGRPVIAYARGGALETVRFRGSRRTGVPFSELSEDCIASAVRNFLDQEDQFSVRDCVRQASRFNVERFMRGMHSVVLEFCEGYECDSELLKQSILKRSVG